MILRTIERKIESLVEGVFGRAFRTNVQPVELARKLTKEMDDHRTVSVSRIYVPNEYTIYLSTPDRSQFEAYEGSLTLELQEYVGQHAKREGYVMLAAPKVVFTTDDDLSLGEFGIATRMVQGRPREGAVDLPPPAAEPAQTMVYRPSDGAPPDGGAPVAAEVVALVLGGTRHRITRRTTVIGRSQSADLHIDDANVSRKHAELRQQGTAYWIVDLDSTNGIMVNGERAQRAKLEDGDTVTLGETELVFSRATP